MTSMNTADNQNEMSQTIYQLALLWSQGELDEGVDWGELEGLLNRTQEIMGRERMRNHARGITAERLSRTYHQLAPALHTTTTDLLLGRGHYETVDQWMQRLESEGPEAVSDFIDKAYRALPASILPGDNGHRYALVQAMVCNDNAGQMTLTQAIEADYDEALI